MKNENCRVRVPRNQFNTWKQARNTMEFMKTIERPLAPISKSFKGMTMKFHTAEVDF